MRRAALYSEGRMDWRSGVNKVTTFLHEGDLPDGALAGASAVAVDSETMGLRLGRDPLCVVQLSAGDGDAHVVRLDRADLRRPEPEAPADRSGGDQDLPLRPLRYRHVLAAPGGGDRPRSTAPRSPPSWRAPTPTATG